MSEFKFNLGDEVKDLVTGVQGVIVSKTIWLNGCKRYTLERSAPKEDGTLHEAISVDEQQLVVVAALKINVGQPLNGEAPKPFTGGPKPMPKATGR